MAMYNPLRRPLIVSRVCLGSNRTDGHAQCFPRDGCWQRLFEFGRCEEQPMVELRSPNELARDEAGESHGALNTSQNKAVSAKLRPIPSISSRSSGIWSAF